MYSNLKSIIKSNVDDVEKLNLILKVDNIEHIEYDDSDNESDDSSNDANSTSSTRSIQKIQNIHYNFTSSMPYDEQVEQIISTFKDDHLSKIILLNKAQQGLLQETIKEHLRKISEIDTKLNKISEILKDQDVSKSKKYHGCKYGVPYFKTQQFYCPPNQDKITKDRNGEFCQMDLPPLKIWTDSETKLLVNYVKEESKNIRINQLKAKLKQLSRPIFNRNKIDKETATKIEEISNQIEKWKLKDSAECIFPVNEKNVPIDWMKVGVLELNSRHGDCECKAMWYCCLHPQTKNTSFSKSEFEKMTEIAKENNFQNWDLIAEQLGTNRSGYICCLTYQLNQLDRFKKSKWSPEEDAYLLEVVENCRVGNYIPWNKVSYFIRNRTKNQIYMRYTYNVAAGIRKGKFSEAEDALLLMFIDKFGPNYSKIAKNIPNRTSIQIRERYLNNLQHDGKTRGEWTLAEDEQIEKFVNKHGEKSWAALAAAFKSKYARTRNNLRHRWTTLKKFYKENPGATIQDAPRRKKRTSRKYVHKEMKTVVNILQSKNLKNSGSIKKKLSLSNYNLTDVSNALKQIQDKELFGNDKLMQHIITSFRNTCVSRNYSEICIINVFFIMQIIDARINVPESLSEIVGYKYLPAFEKDVLNGINDFVHEFKECPTLGLNEFLFNGYTQNDPKFTKNNHTLLQFIPSFLQSGSNFDLTLTHCKVAAKYFTWHKSDLEGHYVKKYGKFIKVENGNNDNVEIEKWAVIENNLTNKIATQCCEDLLTCHQCVTLQKNLSTDEFKKRLFAFFLLPTMEPFVNKMCLEFDLLRMKTETDPECDVIVERIEKPARKRGRPRKEKKNFKSNKSNEESEESQNQIEEPLTDAK